VEVFAAEYKWSVACVLSHTLFQLRSLGPLIATRRYHERRLAADAIRYAHHADRNEYDRWLESLKPEEGRSDPTSAAPIPPDVVYRKEL